MLLVFVGLLYLYCGFAVRMKDCFVYCNRFRCIRLCCLFLFVVYCFVCDLWFNSDWLIVLFCDVVADWFAGCFGLGVVELLLCGFGWLCVLVVLFGSNFIGAVCLVVNYSCSFIVFGFVLRFTICLLVFVNYFGGLGCLLVIFVLWCLLFDCY